MPDKAFAGGDADLKRPLIGYSVRHADHGAQPMSGHFDSIRPRGTAPEHAVEFRNGSYRS